MDLDQIIEPRITAAQTPPALSGRVSRLNGAGEAFVVIPALSLDYEHGPVKFGTVGGAAPTVGAECLITFDEENTPWITSWVGVAPGAAGGGGTVALDSNPVGAVIAWTSQTIPDDYLLLNAQVVAEADFPQLVDFAAAEAAAGNAIWNGTVTGTAPDRTLTLPDFRDRFLYGTGAKALGTKGGAETVVLQPRDLPGGFPAWGSQPPGWPFYADVVQGSTSPLRAFSNPGQTAVDKMPPYVVLGWIVKAKALEVTTAGSLQGPPGPQGIPGDAPTLYTLDPWQAATFAAGWSDYPVSGGFRPAAFRKMPDGKVELRGLLSVAAGAGTTMFTLPAGYRPSAAVMNAQETSSGLGRIDIAADGRVVAVSPGLVAGQWWSIDGIEFDTETVTTMLAGPKGDPGGVVGAPPVVTALPSSPVDGEEVYYRFAQDVNPADARVLQWHLRWDAGAAKWLPVGRQEPVYALQSPLENFPGFGANVWGGVNANDPRVTFPLAGEYDIHWGAGQFWVTSVGNWYIATYWPGAEQTSNGVQPSSDIAAPPGVGTYSSAHARKKVVVAAAGQQQRHRYYTTVAGTIYRGSAYIEAFPLAIDPVA